MTDKRFHSIDEIKKEGLGTCKSFPNPFFYTPSEMAKAAVSAFQATLPILEEGKMFGILLVEYKGKMGYLQAYSGQLEGANDDEFVPAIFDYLQPDGYFKTHEAEITAINKRIAELKQADNFSKAQQTFAELKAEANETISTAQKAIVVAKMLRDKRRKEAFVSERESEEMVRESQYMKAELHRTKKRYAALLSEAEAKVNDFQAEITELKLKRKRMSDQLQRWLFSQFTLQNALGERKDLLSVYRDYYLKSTHHSALATRILATNSQNTLFPPSGTGECCEPKLLQYAFEHDMRPIEMAMFWWGAAPKTEIRQHKTFYPACNGKCKPLLEWYLKGINVAPNPLETSEEQSLKIIYEDNDLAVIVKPSGMLTVAGRSQRQSVEAILRTRWNLSNTPIIVHRLDMATSGLLVVARNKEAHKDLQAQFNNRSVKKRYTALLSTALLTKDLPTEGTISLPLCADLLDRPRQIVDHEQGKPATTYYKIIGKTPLNDSKIKEAVRVELQPLTGRTHQLRVHCAHLEGLNTPILGDTLYGTAADRLYLHAEYLSFVHPRTGKELQFQYPMEY